ncbi:MAG TPA: Fe-S cluster assembly protein SufD [Longimicrobiales bacterium]|nr:Fe-S cluster assembly protein SufD [Longimicrobiales bacterium]
MASTMTAPGTGAAYDQDTFDGHNQAGPSWLRDWRRDSFRDFQTLPLPTTALEEWRYTDPKRLKWDRVRVAPDASTAAVPEVEAKWLKERTASGRVLQVGTHLVQIELDDALRGKGVILMDLAVAAEEHPELVRKHLGSAVDERAGKFAALNGAFWSAGVFLYVPRGVRIDAPIRVLRHLTDAGAAYFPRTLIVAEEGSHVGFVEELDSPDFDTPVFSCGAVEVIAGNAADVQYVALQRYGANVHHLSTQRTIAGRDANLDTLVVNLGASVARVDLLASLQGPGSRSDMLGLYFGRGNQHFDHSTRQDHTVPHATSDLLYKGALTDSAHAVFRGLIKVFPKAQRTDAYQTNRNLILSKKAEAIALPNLEIEADDVRCSHAATVGQLDEEELFYIMSRGISREMAEKLVVFGFFGEVLDRLPMPGVVEELRRAIEERITA